MDLLSKHPTIVCKMLGEVTGNGYCYSVVAPNGVSDKIGIIKDFRNINCCGLAVSKAWCEGALFKHGEFTLDPGVIAKGMPKEEAEKLASNLFKGSNIAYMVVKDGTHKFQPKWELYQTGETVIP